MQDSFRRSSLTLTLPGPLAVAIGQATYVVPRPAVIAAAQLCLSDSGVGAGSTNVNVNVNGAAINAANSLAVVGAAGNKSVSAPATGQTFPGGTRVNAGDTITVDVTAVPATTAPKAGFIVLDLIEADV